MGVHDCCAKDYGALSQVEAWEADVADGKLTDFRCAVNLEPGEKVVFSWVTWPDKATADASHDKMMAGKHMQVFGDLPFSGERMIYGGFEPLVVRSVDQASQEGRGDLPPTAAAAEPTWRRPAAR